MTRHIGPLGENMTSSTKPEVHTVSQDDDRVTAGNNAKIGRSSAVWFTSYASGQTDRQTDLSQYTSK